jgi:phage regulator Rha-like protein
MEINPSQIENRIYAIRGVQVMLDSDLAEMFHVQTKVLNQTVKRNIERFPEIFCFQMYDTEWQSLRSQIVTLEVQKGKHRKYLPYVFTEQGVTMHSAVLKSEVAIKVSIQIIQAFVAMRKTLGQFHSVIQRLEGVELKQINMDSKLEQVLKALESDVPLKLPCLHFFLNEAFQFFLFG